MYRSVGKHAVSVPIGVILCIAGCAVADEPQKGTAATRRVRDPPTGRGSTRALRLIGQWRGDADYLRRVVGRELIRHWSRRDPPDEMTTLTLGGQCWYSARTDIPGCP